MSSESVEELYSLLGQYRDSTNNFLLQSNDFLSLSKPTDENLIKYTANSKANKLPIFFLYLHVLLKFTKLVIRILFQFIHFSAKRDISIVSSLLVSHYFGEDKLKDEDNFFGSIPHTALINDYEFNYIDQTKTSFFSRRIHVKKNNRSVYLIGFNTLNFELLQLIVKNLKTSFGLLKKRDFENSTFGKSILLKTALSQVSDLTLRNQILAIEIAQTIRRRKVQSLWLTFEGHGFERSIIAYFINNPIDSVSINLYQHAPIVKAQLGLFQMIEDFKNAIHIHTSGEITYDFITSKFPNDELRISVLGSSKNHVTNLFSNNSNSKRESLLFLPEGTIGAFNEMVVLAMDLRRKYDGKIIIRPHPNLPIKNWKEVGMKLESLDLDLSLSAIEEDFLKSQYCVYRSSAAAIESLKYGVLPLSFQSISQMNLDCLALNDLRYPKFQSVDELIEILNFLKSNISDSFFSSQLEFEKYADKYFVNMISRF